MHRTLALILGVLTVILSPCPQRSRAQGPALQKSAGQVDVSGVVTDSLGAVVPGASVLLMNANNAIVAVTKTDAAGHFLFFVRPGSYLMAVTAGGLAEKRLAVNVRPPATQKLDITLEPETLKQQITVTAHPGLVENIENLPQQVNVIDGQQIQVRAKAVLAQAVEEEPGVQLQRTSPTIGGIFVRGLTGNKVNVFVDGVRYSTSAMRGGINTFLDLLEPTSLQSVEIIRGPSSAQYGSDAIGGSVQALLPVPSFTEGRPYLRGRLGTFFDSADAGYGSDLAYQFAMRNFGLLGNFAGRRANTLRAGAGIDSHSAVTRFFGLRSDLFSGARLPDTAFSQYGGMIKINWAPRPGSQFAAFYNRGQQDGGKRYDQLLGGDGNLVADLRNLMLDLFYVRYDRLRLGWLEDFSLGYSFNSQREERVNQGGNGNPRAAINHEYERTRAHGVRASAARPWGSGRHLLFGGEFYQEGITAPSFAFNPTGAAVTLRRGRVPNGAGYRSGGAYAQQVFELVPGKLRLAANVRYAAAAYEARAKDSPSINGKRLWPDDFLTASSVTFRGGAVWTPLEGLSLSGNISRGFRAPHTTDLGTLGLTGSGFEVAAPDLAGMGATVGSSADSKAASSGESVRQVGPETSLSYEAGVRYRNRRVNAALSFFVNNIYGNIAKQALILPAGAVGRQLGGEPITAQNPNGVVFVAASTNPVLVRANFGDARIYGFEHSADLRISSNWSAGTIFTWLHAADRKTGLPPNIEGGTPAPDGYLKFRYMSRGRRVWVEPYIHAAARQDRLSSLDLEDRRTGAMRSRSSISNFFLNGATARGWVAPGPDAKPGTADDVLIATGETLSQIQQRVLGPGLASAPLFSAIPGYATFNLRAGLRLGGRQQVMLDFQNIADRNYRAISWGLDGPGRGVFVRYTIALE